jgi:leucyl aminopeptidase
MDNLGLKFYKKFINKREGDWNRLTNDILYYLSKNNINHSIEIFDKDSLSSQFFSSGCWLTINPNSQKDISLIGKGVCFDTGGWSQKTPHAMSCMHYDKTGALLSIATAINLNCKSRTFFTTNIHTVFPDTILNEPNTKKRIVIENTDAEGRIGLADLLATETCSKIITMATLTGSAIQITGYNTYAMVHSTNPVKHYPLILNKSLKNELKLWVSPLHKNYDNSINTKIKGANITNDPCLPRGGAGSSLAFSFLKSFIKQKQTLIHVDMAAMDVDIDGNGVCWGLNEIKYLSKII